MTDEGRHEPGDPDCELLEVRYEQAFHLRSFVGREQVLSELRDWLDRDEGGYLLVLGGPGQGKSALLAALAEREQDRGGALLHMIKSHRSPSRFVPALISQAARLSGLRFGAGAYEGDEDDLRDALLRALSAMAERRGRAVLIIDALDELDAAGRRLTFLPRVLPPGVRVVLSCRPDVPLVEALRAHLEDLEERTLPPFDQSDVAALIEAHLGPGRQSPVEPSDLLERAGGSPLLLRRSLERVVDWLESGTEAFDWSTLPRSHEELFAQIYAEIAEKEQTRYTSEEGRNKARIIQLLSVAREPLGVGAIAELLSAWGRPASHERCRDRIRETSQYLLDMGGERYKPWHQGLADYVTERVLGAEGLRAVESVFADWLESGKLSDYGLRHLVDYLLAAGRVDEACARLTDPAFLEAKVRAGLVFELVGELGRVDRLERDTPLVSLVAEIVRHHAHFLRRRPGALFQLLYNAGHWHDAPEAADHYDPPLDTGEPILSSWVERWRWQRREPWLRSLRPPPTRLGEALVAVLRGHEGRVESVTFAAEGEVLVSSGVDGTVRLWDASTAATRQVLRASSRGRVRRVASAPGRERIASGGADGIVRLWDLRGHEIACLRGHAAEVYAVALGPDGRIASGGRDHTVRLWGDDGETHRLGVRGLVYGVALSPDGERLAAASTAARITVWRIADGETMLTKDFAHTPISVAFLSEGRMVAAFADGAVRILDDEGEVLEELELPLERLTTAALSPDERWVACGCSSGRIWLWERGSSGPRTALIGHRAWVRGLAFSPDGARLASASSDSTVRLWNARAGSDASVLRGDRVRIACARFSHAGERLAVGGYDGVVQLWNVERGLPRALLEGHRNAVVALAFSPDDTLLATGSLDGTVRVWRGDREIARLEGHAAAVTAVAFTADGGRIVTGSSDHTVRVFSLFGARQLARLDHDASVAAVAVADDAVFAVGRGGELRAWRLEGGERTVAQTISLPAMPVDLAVDAEGTRVALGLRDGTAGLWTADEERWIALPAPRADLQAMVQGAEPAPHHGRAEGDETVVRRCADGAALAHHPHALPHLVTSPSGRLWAGWIHDHLHLLALEEP